MSVDESVKVNKKIVLENFVRNFNSKYFTSENCRFNAPFVIYQLIQMISLSENFYHNRVIGSGNPNQFYILQLQCW